MTQMLNWMTWTYYSTLNEWGIYPDIAPDFVLVVVLTIAVFIGFSYLKLEYKKSKELTDDDATSGSS